MSLGERLHEARIKARFSQESVATRIGVHYTTIGKYEKNETIPPAAKLARLVEIYHDDANYILFGNTTRVINITNLPNEIVEKLNKIITDYERLHNMNR